MSLSLLLDEMVEQEVMHRLENFGHDVEHVDFHDEVGKGDSDRKLADYSLENKVLIVTHDPDFGDDFDESDYWGALGFSDDDWSAKQVADVAHVILDFYDEATVRTFNTVGREWLSRI